MSKEAKQRPIPCQSRQGVIHRCPFICAGLLLCLVVLTSTIRGALPPGWQSQSGAITSNDPSQGVGDVRLLEPGKPIERVLARGESHSYHINLSAGQFLHVVAEQRGIDVIASLSGPDGRQVAETDGPKGALGSERLLFVTEQAGPHRLDVRALEGQAPSGRYEVRIEEQRPATSQDRGRLTAYRSFARGQQLLAEASAASLREAIDKFSEALPLWRMAGDRRAEAITLSHLAKSYDSLGEKLKALGFYNRALPLLQAVGDNVGEATTLNNIGLIYDALGEKQKALDYYNRALPILRAVGDRRVEAYTLNNIGLAYDSLGEKQRALDHYQQALRMLQAVGDRRAEAAALNNIGFVYNSLGEKERALEYFGQSLPILRAAGDRHVEAVTVNNIGFVYDSLGEKEKALEYFGRALPVLRLVGDRRVEAVTLNNIGLVYESRGERLKALEYFNLALPLRRAVGDRQGEAVTLGDIGHIHASAGEHLKALDYYDQALSLSRAVEDRSQEATTLRRIALVERDRGNLAGARARIEAALGIVESLRARIASRELRVSYFASVQQYFETYIDLLMRLDARRPGEGHDGAALQAGERARARGLLEMLSEAGANISQGVAPELLERKRSLQQTLNAKAAAQSRLMQGSHSAEQAVGLKKEISHLLAQYQEVEAQIRVSSPRYAALTQPSPLSLREIQQRVLDHDTLLLEYALGTERSYLWAVTSDSLRSFELPPRAEIENATRRVYELLTARNRRVKFETAEERQGRIADADAEYSKASAALSQTLLSPVATQLGRTGKKRLLVVGDGALNYVPFAALPIPEARRPARAARRGDGGRVSPTAADTSPRSNPSFIPLVLEHEIVNLPSVSALEVLRRETAGRRPAPKTLAVLADPVFEKDDERLKTVRTVGGSPASGAGPAEVRASAIALKSRVQGSGQHSDGADEGGRLRRLPYTRLEADAILSLVSEADRMKALDFDASRATATGPELGRYRFVHFATHGLLDSEHPELSGIVLSLFDRQGGEQDGFLRAHEVFNLRLPAELVVLSGCRTGLGKEIRGEGLIGLTRGFMYAGAARVMVSLWDVSDEASAELMVEFYKAMLGRERLRPASALRAAQVALWKQGRWQAPYYWAAFVLQGEPS